MIIKYIILSFLVYNADLYASDADALAGRASASLSPLGSSDTSSLDSDDLKTFFAADGVSASSAPVSTNPELIKKLRENLIANNNCLVCAKPLSHLGTYGIGVHYSLSKLANPVGVLKKGQKKHVSILSRLQKNPLYTDILTSYIDKYRMDAIAKSAKSAKSAKPGVDCNKDFLAKLIDLKTRKCLICSRVFPGLWMDNICGHYGIESLVLQGGHIQEATKNHIVVLKGLQDTGLYSDIFKTRSESILRNKARYSKQTKRKPGGNSKLSHKSKRICKASVES